MSPMRLSVCLCIFIGLVTPFTMKSVERGETSIVSCKPENTYGGANVYDENSSGSGPSTGENSAGIFNDNDGCNYDGGSCSGNGSDDDSGIFTVQYDDDDDDGNCYDCYDEDTYDCYTSSEGDEKEGSDNDDGSSTVVHEHPNYLVREGWPTRAWNALGCNFFVVVVVLLALFWFWNFVQLRPFDFFSQVFPDDREFLKEQLLIQASRNLVARKGAQNVCGWEQDPMTHADIVNSDLKNDLWDDVTFDDLSRHGIMYDKSNDLYYVDKGMLWVPSRCFFYDLVHNKMGFLIKVSLCFLLVICCRRLARVG